MPKQNNMTELDFICCFAWMKYKKDTLSCKWSAKENSILVTLVNLANRLVNTLDFQIDTIFMLWSEYQFIIMRSYHFSGSFILKNYFKNVIFIIPSHSILKLD